MYMDVFISRLNLQIAGIVSAYLAPRYDHELNGVTLRAAAGEPGPGVKSMDVLHMQHI